MLYFFKSIILILSALQYSTAWQHQVRLVESMSINMSLAAWNSLLNWQSSAVCLEKFASLVIVQMQGRTQRNFLSNFTNFKFLTTSCLFLIVPPPDFRVAKLFLLLPNVDLGNYLLLLDINLGKIKEKVLYLKAGCYSHCRTHSDRLRSLISIPEV